MYVQVTLDHGFLGKLIMAENLLHPLVWIGCRKWLSWSIILALHRRPVQRVRPSSRILFRHFLRRRSHHGRPANARLQQGQESGGLHRGRQRSGDPRRRRSQAIKISIFKASGYNSKGRVHIVGCGRRPKTCELLELFLLLRRIFRLNSNPYFFLRPMAVFILL